MIIYSAETKIEGLVEKVMANKSIAYCAGVEEWTDAQYPDERKLAQAAFKSQASIKDIDLYITKSIFVTTNWNGNDDIFSPSYVWPARHTPQHKPTNINHDETQLVGHMTNTWAIDKDYNVIPDDSPMDLLPDLFHIANGAVIYRHWNDEALVERAETLIASIKAGEMYVSMEALFSDFDYGIKTPEGDYYVTARDNSTAFLTKYLRAYGGSGVFDDCKIGRLMKNIIFCGKGYVQRPANPESIMLPQDADEFNFSSATLKNLFEKKKGVFISYRDNSHNIKAESSLMSDTNTTLEVLTAQVNEYKATVATLNEQLKKAESAVSKAGVESLEKQVAELQTKFDATVAELTKANTKIETLTSEVASATQKHQEVASAKESLEKELAEAKLAQVTVARVSHLVDGGVDKAEAEAKVAIFASLNDDQFEAVAKEMIDKVAAMCDGDKEKDKKKKDEEANASTLEEEANASTLEEEDAAAASASDDVLDNATPDTQPNLSAQASQKEQLDADRAELQRIFAGQYGTSESNNQ